jgi:hypothetical protein
MKRRPWLLIGTVVGAVAGALDMHVTTPGESQALEFTKPMWFAFFGLAIGLAVDLWRGFRDARK